MITENVSAEDKPVVQLAGGVATKNAFHVFDTATTEQLIQTLGRVREMEAATAWWMGDIGLAISERKQKEAEVKGAELRKKAESFDGSDADQVAVKEKLLAEATDIETHSGIKYRDELAKRFGINAGYLANCVSLARAYPPSARNEGASVQHFIAVAPTARKEPEKAQLILEEAVEKKWSASELRQTLAERNATARPPSAPPESFDFRELAAADAWAIKYKEKAKTLDPLKAEHILGQITELRSLITLLESIAKGMS